MVSTPIPKLNHKVIQKDGGMNLILSSIPLGGFLDVHRVICDSIYLEYLSCFANVAVVRFEDLQYYSPGCFGAVASERVVI